ncbi:DUF2461 domain-containing protein [Mariniflexile ostreae]|uniref:DUF2461 domain-containing protein n=1 Tax=Mariniflexile ostreae TaxID=1520892 RepID=A0ABV5FE23_9FLAO
MATPIPKEALEFLDKVKKNNDRDWFNDRKTEFKAIEAQVKEVYHTVFENLKTHDDVDKVKMFRIYRDVRFSKNKAPYKTHFGGAIHRRKPKLRGSYYLHIQPNNESFIATGFWEPNKEDLLRIRKEFERDDTEIRDILSAKLFKNTWGELQGESLKTAPRGFNKDHQSIDLIRKKQFVFTKKFTDEAVLQPDFIEHINAAFKIMRPYLNYMSDVLTTDLNGVSSV